VTNFTNVTPWPTTSGAYQSAISSTAGISPFVTKVSADGSKLIYSTLEAGGVVRSMILTPDHEVILAGDADTPIVLTPDAYSSTPSESFITKLSADGSQLSYSTYFGNDVFLAMGNISSLALDPAGNVWVGGYTGESTNFPLVIRCNRFIHQEAPPSGLPSSQSLILRCTTCFSQLTSTGV
jgi:hypothetical protein